MVSVGVGRGASEAHHVRILKLVHVTIAIVHVHVEALLVGEDLKIRQISLTEAVDYEAEADARPGLLQRLPTRVEG